MIYHHDFETFPLPVIRGENAALADHDRRSGLLQRRGCQYFTLMGISDGGTFRYVPGVKPLLMIFSAPQSTNRSPLACKITQTNEPPRMPRRRRVGSAPNMNTALSH